MNNWRFLIIPVLGVSGLLLGAYHAAQEVDARTYNTVANAWPRLSAGTQQDLSTSMRDAKLTTWEYQGQARQILEEAGFLLIMPGEEDQQRARERFIARMSQSNSATQ